MFPASFSLSPNVLVLLQRSEPARSHRENLKTQFTYYIHTLKKKKTTKIFPLGTHSEIHFTVPSSIFSSFMVKMLWLQENLV